MSEDSKTANDTAGLPLESTTTRRPLANISSKMQSPPKEHASSSHDTKDDLDDFFQPQFGKASPMRNPLASHNVLHNPLRGPPSRKPPASLSINRWKASRDTPAGQPAFKQPNRDISQRASYQLPGQRPASPEKDVALLQLQKDMQRPTQTNIFVPHNATNHTTYAPAAPVFNSLGAGRSVPLYKTTARSGSSSNATPRGDEDDDDQFDPDAAVVAETRAFGSADPYMYLDSEQANQNIKGLLEGAFDNEEDKSKIRLRQRAKKTSKQADERETKSLADKLSQLSVKSDNSAVSATVDEEDDGTVEGMAVKLLPHQVEGVSWMIDKEAGKRKNGILPRGGILADDMGLGKTVQSVALILLNPRPPLDAPKEYPKQKLPGASIGRGTLVVAPLALIKQWEGEIQSKVAQSHALKVLVHHGPGRTKSADQLRKYDVVITTYQILTSEHAASNLDRPDGPRIGCFGVHWYRIMLDEAHSIKNRNAKSTIACCALESWNRWCLTGTPMQNNLDELQSLIKFLRIKPYCNLSSWKDQITQPMKAGRGGLAMARLHHYLNAFMKRRTKDILKKDGALTFGGNSKDKDGNAKTEGLRIVGREVLTVECQFDEQEQAFYDRLSDRAQQKLNDMLGAGGKTDYIGALVLLLRLRQACNHPALIEAAITKDSDAIDVGATPRAGSVVASKFDDDMDSLAALMGGVSVETRNCDVCQFTLTADQVRADKTRCAICEQNISSMKDTRKMSKQRPEARRRRVVDSDDSDTGDGEVGSINTSDDNSPAQSHTTPPRGTRQQPSTKVRHILSILHNEASKHKFIIFSQFTSMLDIIQPHVKHRYVRYDGSMRPDEREAALSSLRNDPKTRVLLCSLKCGSLGLNLTAASRVIIVEPFWNPFVEEQAIDRVHRLNQTVDVKVFRLTVVGSVEERILALQERKRQLATAAIEGGKAIGKLSMADVLSLFRRDVHNDAVSEEDRKFAAKFGNDSRLIDGASQSRNTHDMQQKSGKARAVEHEVYGRRW